MATGAIGKLTQFINSVVNLGAVVSDSWIANVDANINGWLTAAGNNLTAPILNGAATGTSAPTPTPTAYALYKELVPIAVANISNPAGTLTFTRGVNISAAARVGTGAVDVTLQNVGANPNDLTFAVTPFIAAAVFCSAQYIGSNKVRVFTFDNTGAAADKSFGLAVWGS